MEKKQSSIEWFAMMLAEQGLLITKDYENLITYKEAKAMHKEEQENTWEIAWDESSKFDYCKNKYNGGFQQYYKETFGGQDNE